MKSIEIYGKPHCDWCKRALALVQAFNLPMIYRDISNPADRAEMFRRNPDAKTVPQIFIGDTLIGGFTELQKIPILKLQQMVGE